MSVINVEQELLAIAGKLTGPDEIDQDGAQFTEMSVIVTGKTVNGESVVLGAELVAGDDPIKRSHAEWLNDYVSNDVTGLVKDFLDDFEVTAAVTEGTV